ALLERLPQLPIDHPVFHGAGPLPLLRLQPEVPVAQQRGLQRRRKLQGKRGGSHDRASKSLVKSTMRASAPGSDASIWMPRGTVTTRAVRPSARFSIAAAVRTAAWSTPTASSGIVRSPRAAAR